MFCFYNDGKSNKVVDDSYTAQSGEVLFADEPQQSDLVAAFTNYTAVVAASTLAANLLAAQMLLNKTDRVVKRIQEAVSLGLNTYTADDVVAYIIFVRALRAWIKNPSGNIPTEPNYPVGT